MTGADARHAFVAALWPERAQWLVTGNGYNIQDIAAAGVPASAEQEHRYWYQYYFQIERGRAGLNANRRELVKLLWRLWSPNWQFSDATFERSAPSWDNPDFVDVTIQSYRHRYGNAPGDRALESVEQALTRLPPITVPTIVVQGEANGVVPELWTMHRHRFTARAEQRAVARVGHNIPAEAPEVVADAVLDLVQGRHAD
jgi:pimeloyl-ACP methyl ester carboxylesterase